METNTRGRGGLIWPVLLIGAGIVFLLNNLGVLDWGVWNTLLRLWPVLLVAIGLDLLIGRRSTWGSALVAVLLVIVLGAAIVWGGPRLGVARMVSVDRTETISEDLQGANKASIEVSFGTGNLLLGALPEGSAKLIEGNVDLSRNERLQSNLRGASGDVRYTLKSNNTSFGGMEVIDQAEDKVWDLQVNRDIPVALDINAGVGKSTLNLTSLNLTRLDVDGGVGQVTVRLAERGSYNVNVDGGLGELILVVPEALGARIRVNGGLGSVDVQGDFERAERQYTTSGFSTAEDRVEIQIDGGLGRVQIRRAAE